MANVFVKGCAARLAHLAAGLAFVFLASVPARADLVYTCDPTIAAVTCNTLNTNIKSLYTNYFNDVNASIYITLGNTGLGASSTALNRVNYDGANGYYNALKQDRTSADDFTAVNSLPAGNAPAPLPGNLMFLTNANVRALPGLGLTPKRGLQSDGDTFCNIGDAGCYDGVITMSQAIFGIVGPPQFDFYTVAQHETDEVLGTGSCAFNNNGNSPGCVDGSGNTRFAPIDLFRYHGNGNRTFTSNPSGDNKSCFDNTTTNNACFSIDGGNTMIIGFNNILNGANTADAGDYSTNCAHVQDAAGCAGQSFNVDPNFELKELDVIGYTMVPEPAAMPIVALIGAGFFWGVRSRRRRGMA